MKNGVLLLCIFIMSCSDGTVKAPGEENAASQSEKPMQFEKKNIVQYTNGQDSVKFFRDADWITLKGKDELTEDKFSYPFVCYSYQKDVTDLMFFYGENQVRHWYLHKKGNITFVRFSHYDKQYQDTLYKYLIYNGDKDTRFQLDCFSPDIFSGNPLLVRSIIKFEATAPITIKEKMYMASFGERSATLENLFQFDSKLSSIFEEYSESTVTIKDKKLVQISGIDKNFKTGAVTTTQEEKIRASYVDQTSFSFFYATVFRDWTILK